MHLVFLPLAFVCLSIRPHIAALSRDLIHLEVSEVDATVSESQGSATMLLSLEVLTVVFSTVRPGLNSLSVLLIVKPLADICGTIGMGI